MSGHSRKSQPDGKEHDEVRTGVRVRHESKTNRKPVPVRSSQ